MQVSNWVVAELISEKDVTARILYLKKLINIALVCSRASFFFMPNLTFFEGM